MNSMHVNVACVGWGVGVSMPICIKDKVSGNFQFIYKRHKKIYKTACYIKLV